MVGDCPLLTSRYTSFSFPVVHRGFVVLSSCKEKKRQKRGICSVSKGCVPAALVPTHFWGLDLSSDRAGLGFAVRPPTTGLPVGTVSRKSRVHVSEKCDMQQLLPPGQPTVGKPKFLQTARGVPTANLDVASTEELASIPYRMNLPTCSRHSVYKLCSQPRAFSV